jgi:hemerythrin-like metal-binding protein
MSILDSRFFRFFSKKKKPMKIDRQLFRTGHSLIDSQHEAYLDLLDEIFALGREPLTDKSKLDKALDEAIDYGLKHFIVEEELMEAMNYPDIDAHRKKHSEFRGRVENLRRAGKYMSPDDFLHEINLVMVKWLCEQMQTYDRALAEFIEKNKTQ